MSYALLGPTGVKFKYANILGLTNDDDVITKITTAIIMMIRTKTKTTMTIYKNNNNDKVNKL